MNRMKYLKTLIRSVLILAGINSVSATEPKGAGLGEPATAEEIAAWDITVMPDGEGLPAGQGSVAAGKKIYAETCVACHGPQGIGGNAEKLAGAEMSLTSEYPEKTIGSYWPYATTLFDLIRRSMPMTAPGSLSNDEVYAVTAYLLYLNNIIDEDTVLDAASLPQVEMPNREGFIDIYQQELSTDKQ